MSNPSPAHRPAGTPDGGQFARTTRAEAAGVQELDGTHGPEVTPTDPRQLIEAHDRQREADQEKIDDLWNTACGNGDFEEYESAKDGYNEMEFQRYRSLADAVRNAPAPAPVIVPRLIGPAEAIRDRKALDAIACTLGEAQEWDSEFVEMVADTVRSSGRPHPGEPALSDKELGAIEDTGADPAEAYAQAYRDKLAGSHAAATNTKLDATALGTAGLDDDLNATYFLMRDAENRVQALTTRSLARRLLTSVPDAAYLDIARDEENRSHMTAVGIVGKDGASKDVHEWEWETAEAPEITYLASQLEFDNDQWTRFTVDAPPNEQYETTYRMDLWAATRAADS